MNGPPFWGNLPLYYEVPDTSVYGTVTVATEYPPLVRGRELLKRAREERRRKGLPFYSADKLQRPNWPPV